MKHISERELQLPDALIGKLQEISESRKDVISLGPGEPDFPPPKPIVNYTKKIAHLVGHYSPPGGRQDLREAIARKLRKENKIRTKPENVVVTCGSQEALLLAMLSSVDVNEQVIVPNPSYLGYIPVIELADAVPMPVRLKEENKFEIVPDDVEKLINKKTTAIIINTPANPTGNVIRKKTLEELADMAVNYDLYMLSDEAYEHIIYDARHISIGSFNGMEDYVVSFFTFSKSYAMCGYRLGYVVAPLNLANAMKKTHMYTTAAAPTISEMLGVRALHLPKHYINSMVAEYRRRRDFIVKRLNGLGFLTPLPEGAFYTFSNVQNFEKSSMKFAQVLLNKAKVAVTPGVEFGSYGEGYIRCSYATDYRLIEKAMDRIEEFLRKY